MMLSTSSADLTFTINIDDDNIPLILKSITLWEKVSRQEDAENVEPDIDFVLMKALIKKICTIYTLYDKHALQLTLYELNYLSEILYLYYNENRINLAYPELIAIQNIQSQALVYLNRYKEVLKYFLKLDPKNQIEILNNNLYLHQI